MKIAVPEQRRAPRAAPRDSHRGRARAQPAETSTSRSRSACSSRSPACPGSGKSTLIEDILHRALARHFYRARVIPGAHDRITGLEHIDKVIDIDQSPIGRTPRSNPATYTGLFTPIRELFAELPEAKIRGYGPGRFSFNVKGGRCEACQGDGLVKIEMHFLPDVYVPCEVCKGKRYNRETLEVRFRGQEHRRRARDDGRGRARRSSRTSRASGRSSRRSYDVGLGYIHLGQSATTLSGGEAQRVKLATELSKRDTGRTLYILDEPTTGLHFEDVRLLLEVLHRLVDRGNTVLVIEHNLDVIKTADWIIDLGPEGGTRGGTVVAAGIAGGGRRRRGLAHRTLLEASRRPAHACARTAIACREHRWRGAQRVARDGHGFAPRHHRPGHGRPVVVAHGGGVSPRPARALARRRDAAARAARAARLVRADGRRPRDRQGARGRAARAFAPTTSGFATRSRSPSARGSSYRVREDDDRRGRASEHRADDARAGRRRRRSHRRIARAQAACASRESTAFRSR